MTDFERRLYEDYVANYDQKAEAGIYPVQVFLSPEAYVQQRKDIAAERKIIAERGGRPVRSIHQEILERITVVSLRSAQTSSRHAVKYLKSLSNDELDRLIAKNPEVAKFAKMGQRQLQEYLLRGGRAARNELFAALPSKRKRKRNGRYSHVASWIDSP